MVLASSTAKKEGVSSWGASYKALRQRLLQDGKLVDGNTPNTYVFKENVSFSSPSAASSQILACNSNGRTEFRVKGTNQTYAEWSDARVNAATPAVAED